MLAGYGRNTHEVQLSLYPRMVRDRPGADVREDVHE